MVSMQAGIAGLTSTIFRAGKAILHVYIKPFCVMLSRSMFRTQDGRMSFLLLCDRTYSRKHNNKNQQQEEP